MCGSLAFGASHSGRPADCERQYNAVEQEGPPASRVTLGIMTAAESPRKQSPVSQVPTTDCQANKRQFPRKRPPGTGENGHLLPWDSVPVYLVGGHCLARRPPAETSSQTAHRTRLSEGWPRVWDPDDQTFRCLCAPKALPQGAPGHCDLLATGDPTSILQVSFQWGRGGGVNRAPDPLWRGPAARAHGGPTTRGHRRCQRGQRLK